LQVHASFTFGAPVAAVAGTVEANSDAVMKGGEDSGGTGGPAITLLSTYFENTGDDLIRAGVQHQLRSAQDGDPRWRHVAKSNPLSLHLPRSRATHGPLARMSGEDRRAAEARVSALRDARSVVRDHLTDASAFVVAGTPIFYFVGDQSFLGIEATYGADWPRVVFAERVESQPHPPMLALGVGSIYEGAPAEVLAAHPPAAEFIRRFVERAALVTTRDAPTDALVRTAAPEHDRRIVRSICPSFWAAEAFGAPVPDPARRVTISFALESVNWDLSAPRDAVVAARERALDRVIAYFRERAYAIALVAHNEWDIEAGAPIAQRWGLPPPAPVDARQLVEAAARSHAVVTWRVHGAIAARSVGRPALLFRTDGRWQSAAEVGADVLDDRNCGDEELEAALDRLCAAGNHDPAETMAAAGALRSTELARLRAPLEAAFG
jgi:Polysaccharide pyruvyl transferase